MKIKSEQLKAAEKFLITWLPPKRQTNFVGTKRDILLFIPSSNIRNYSNSLKTEVTLVL